MAEKNCSEWSTQGFTLPPIYSTIEYDLVECSFFHNEAYNGKNVGERAPYCYLMFIFFSSKKLVKILLLAAGTSRCRHTKTTPPPGKAELIQTPEGGGGGTNSLMSSMRILARCPLPIASSLQLQLLRWPAEEDGVEGWTSRRLSWPMPPTIVGDALTCVEQIEFLGVLPLQDLLQQPCWKEPCQWCILHHAD